MHFCRAKDFNFAWNWFVFTTVFWTSTSIVSELIMRCNIRNKMKIIDGHRRKFFYTEASIPMNFPRLNINKSAILRGWKKCNLLAGGHHFICMMYKMLCADGSCRLHPHNFNICGQDRLRNDALIAGKLCIKVIIYKVSTRGGSFQFLD